MVFHILNGDSLKEQFPADHIPGELIIMRECLVDGDVNGATTKELFSTRAASMHEMYGTTRDEYYDKAVPELTKIDQLTSGEANLWFEDDLFCQVNLWFVCSVLAKKEVNTCLIRPPADLQYGFSGMNQDKLVAGFENRTPLQKADLDGFSSLWTAYQQNDHETLRETGATLQENFPFLKDAIQAQLDRAIDSRPERTLQAIMEETGSEDFGTVFREFWRREPIYGFGDLQVRRLYDQLRGK